MNNIKKTLLLLGSTIVLTGCFSGETSENTGDAEVPTINSLAGLAHNFPMGVAVPAGDASNSILSHPELKAVVEQHFNQITAENIMKPAYLQPTEGSFYFDGADALIDYAENNNISIHGHTLVWHQQSPQWMKNCAGKVDCSTILETHITTVMQHYAGRINSWDVVNEAFLDDGTYRNTGGNGSFWYQKLGASYISKAFIAARAADSNAELYYNDYNIENNGDKLEAVITLVEEMQGASTPIDGIGFQMHIKSDFPTISDITQALQKAVDTGLKVKITELDVRLNETGRFTTLTQTLSETQKQRYKEVVAAYLSTVPQAQRGGISVWGVSDSDSWIVSLYGNSDWPLLFDDELNQKQALQGVAEALQVESTNVSDMPDVPKLFIDDFSEGVSWYLKDQPWQSNITGTFVHNAAEKQMDIDVDWANAGDQFDIARSFPEGTAIDITEGVTMVIKVKMPDANITEGNVSIQPYFESAEYQPAYFGVSQELVVGWNTITIENLSSSFTYNYISETFDFTDINAIGLQIKAQNSVPTMGTIEIGEIYIIDE